MLIVTVLFLQIMCGTKMATEGLPLVRQERGADPDILAGADFLSVFMGSTLRKAFGETTTSTEAVVLSTIPDLEQTDLNPYVRTSRSTPKDSQAADDTKSLETTVSAKELENSSESSLDGGVIVSVSVSSSVGRTLINKHVSSNTNLQVLDDAASSESSTKVDSTEIPDQELVASEEHPSIVAEANKSEFNVEEKDPITRNTDLETSEFTRSYPASVHVLPRPDNLPFNPRPEFGTQDSKAPFHHTVIYHDTPGDSGSARSVSYSTVIQSIPQANIDKKTKPNDRHERHYNGESFVNKFDSSGEKTNNSKTSPTQNTASSELYSTSRPLRNADNAGPKNWEKPEINYEEHSTKKSITTERNWEMNEKIYSPNNNRPLPRIYGQPEQNYEVDEAVSVISNGRAHGVQSNQPPVLLKEDKTVDKNQKVGYVVEGRNFRKYRLEERTSDGFIVGEYGVVNHDDGSLRGVRYTADGTISPRLIYDALMKFLSL